MVPRITDLVSFRIMYLMFDFTGKWALVTGGTSGIGWAIAQAFSTAGANVISVGLASNETLPTPIRTEILDITDAAGVKKLISSVPELHVVVNAAGIIRRASSERNRWSGSPVRFRKYDPFVNSPEISRLFFGSTCGWRRTQKLRNLC